MPQRIQRKWTKLVLATAAAALVAVATGCSDGESKFERFERVCGEHGGFVVQTDDSFWVDRYECIVDNEILYLPGFT